jgi:DNA-binding MarR family transcriptional regulator
MPGEGSDRAHAPGGAEAGDATAAPLDELADLDRLIHEPARLRILAQLYVVEDADFLFVMSRTGLTQGNLSSHMTRLEQAGYVEVVKGFVGKRPRTTLRLTGAGRRAFDGYMARMRGALEWLDRR